MSRGYVTFSPVGSQFGQSRRLNDLHRDATELAVARAVAGAVANEIFIAQFDADFLRNIWQIVQIGEEMPAAGWLGKKVGRGFYEYDSQGQKKL